MATTKADIVNFAAMHLSVATVQDLENPSSKEERVFAVLYPLLLDSVLSAANWTFAAKRQALALVEGEETGNFEHSYTVPSDCLVPREIVPFSLNDDKPVQFETAVNTAKTGRIILTDEPAPVLLYTAKVELPNLFTSDFIEAFSLLLAARAAKPLKGDLQLGKALFDEYKMAVAQAFATNAASNKRTVSQQNDFISARA
jgi:hypothetical protein